MCDRKVALDLPQGLLLLLLALEIFGAVVVGLLQITVVEVVEESTEHILLCLLL